MFVNVVFVLRMRCGCFVSFELCIVVVCFFYVLYCVVFVCVCVVIV